MYTHIHICVYMCVYICVCIYIYIYIYRERERCTHVYVYMCIYIYIYTHQAPRVARDAVEDDVVPLAVPVAAPPWAIHVYMYVCIYIYIYTHIHILCVYIHICIYIYIYIYVCIHTCTYTYSHNCAWARTFREPGVCHLSPQWLWKFWARTFRRPGFRWLWKFCGDLQRFAETAICHCRTTNKFCRDLRRRRIRLSPTPSGLLSL